MASPSARADPPRCGPAQGQRGLFGELAAFRGVARQGQSPAHRPRPGSRPATVPSRWGVAARSRAFPQALPNQSRGGGRLHRGFDVDAQVDGGAASKQRSLRCASTDLLVVAWGIPAHSMRKNPRGKCQACDIALPTARDFPGQVGPAAAVFLIMSSSGKARWCRPTRARRCTGPCRDEARHRRRLRSAAAMARSSPVMADAAGPR